MILVIVVSWLRYFSYFLVVRIISKLTIILFHMLKEVLSFMIILVCYFMLMMSIFATLFRNVGTPDAAPYQSLATTLRILFDYFMG